MTPLKTRILLADDHAMVRRGLRLVLDAEPDLEVVAEAGDGAEAVAARALATDVDLAILDVSMPRLTGLQAARELHRRRPRAARADALDARQRAVPVRGAAGPAPPATCSRRSPTATSSRPCRAAMRGEPFLYPAAVQRADPRLPRARARGEAPPDDPLTPRETEVVKLVAEGYTSREIAETLVISEKTVERHRANILEKLGMRDRVELTRYAIRRGLVEP